MVALLVILPLAAPGDAPGPDGAPEAPAYANHSNLLTFIDGDGEERDVRTVGDWKRRRAHILLGMQAAMGPLPERSDLPPLDVRDHERVAGDGCIRRKISFAVEDGDRLHAFLYVPGGRGGAGLRRPAILALHPTASIGKGVVAGLGDRPNRAYGLELARRGYVVLAPDYPSFGDESDYDFRADDYVSGTMKGIFNHMRCVDLLVSRDDVDPRRIGVIGHSLGGHNAMFVAAFDERIAVCVSSCGWTPFHDYYGGDITGWTSERYMPRLRDVYGLDPDRVPFDFYEVVGALAPRPFFSSSPEKDHNFEVAGVRKAMARARGVYRLFGARERLVARYPECGHDFPEPVRLEAYRFIDRALEHTPSPERDPPGRDRGETGLRSAPNSARSGRNPRSIGRKSPEP